MAPHEPNVLCVAIAQRRLLEFYYQGHFRIVAPYCHGVSKRGAEALRGVQLRGTSSSGGFGFGKLWRVGEMSKIQMIDETFLANDPNYNADDTAMVRIHCRV